MSIKNPLKILCVIQRFSPAIGGSEQLAEKYVDYLSKNHKIDLITTEAIELDSFWNESKKKHISLPSKPYNIKRFPILTPAEIPQNFFQLQFPISQPGPFCPELWQYFENLQEKYDLIIGTSFPYDHLVPAIFYAKKNNLPFVLIPHLHLEFPFLYLNATKLSILSESDAIIVNTNREKTAIEKYVETKKIFVNPPGIDISISKNNLVDMRQKLGLKPDSLFILFVGRKSVEKGTLDLIEATKILISNNKQVDLVFVGPTTSMFEQFLHSLDPEIKKHIFNINEISDDEKWSFFNSCDIFAMPSNSESFGITYLEAWLFHKPVIACEIDAVKEVIDNNENGILVPFNDPTKLNQAIQKLSESNLRQKFGENGFQKLLIKYNIEKNSQNFENICYQISKKNL